MSGTAFFAVSILLLLWILTTAALIMTVRRRNAHVEREEGEPVDLILGLASKRHEEAKEAARRLREVAGFLGIGLVNTGPGGVCLDDCARRMLGQAFPEEAGVGHFFSSIPPGESTTLETGDHVIQVTHLADASSGGLMLMQDVTGAVEAERRLQRRERLAALGKMTAQMAHQMKTHTAILAGRAQLLARRLDQLPGLGDEARGLYREAKDLARRIDGIVRIYKAGGEARETVNVGEALAAVRERLALHEGACRITISAAPDLAISTDRQALENILHLLGENALAPEVGASSLAFVVQMDGGSMRITVSDDGAGIPAPARDRIFEPFTGSREEGLGLGLFLARDLAVRMGGDLELRDVPEGTSFLLSLPA